MNCCNRKCSFWLVKLSLRLTSERQACLVKLPRVESSEGQVTCEALGFYLVKDK